MRKALIALSLSFAAFASVAAHATSYNAVNDFTTASNGAGVWTYGFGTVGSTFTADTVSGAAFGGNSGYAYWAPSTNGLPLVGLNSNATATPGFTPFPADDNLWMHPGNADNLDSIVEFTAPTSGSYNIAGYFVRADQDPMGNGTFVSIYDGATALMGPTFISNTNYTDQTFNQNVTLTAGQTLEFALARNGDYSFDSTGLSLDITTNVAPVVPEPSSLMLFGTGILAVAGTVRRRFKA
jgi:hypothetical protein